MMRTHVAMAIVFKIQQQRIEDLEIELREQIELKEKTNEYVTFLKRSQHVK